jgi:hypothetical protein
MKSVLFFVTRSLSEDAKPRHFWFTYRPQANHPQTGYRLVLDAQVPNRHTAELLARGRVELMDRHSS